MRPRKTMLLVDRGEIVGTCTTTMFCLDSKIAYGLDGKKMGTAWLRSQTWVASEMIRGRRQVAVDKLKKMMIELPEYEALLEDV